MRTVDKVALAAITLAAFSVISVNLFTHVTDRQLAASRAKVREPKCVSLFRELAEPTQTPVASGPDVRTPSPVSPEPTETVRVARETIAAYSELFAKASTWFRERELPGHAPTDASTVTKPFGAPLQLIEQIIETSKRGGPVCLIEISSWDRLEMTHLDNLKLCAALVCGYAREKLSAQDYPEALRAFVAAMNLGDALSMEPLFSSLQTRYEIYRMLMESLDPAALSPELAKSLMERLSRAGSNAPLREVLSGDLQVALSAFKTWRNESYSTFVSTQGVYWGTRSWLWATPVCRPWFDKDQQVTIDMMTHMIEVADQPYYTVKPVLDKIRAEVNNLSLANMAVKPRIHWNLDKFVVQARFESDLNVAQLRIAIEQYRRAHGDYPATLDDVSAWFGGTPPVCPVDGKPYEYTSDGKTFALGKAQPHGRAQR